MATDPKGETRSAPRGPCSDEDLTAAITERNERDAEIQKVMADCELVINIPALRLVRLCRAASMCAQWLVQAASNRKLPEHVRATALADAGNLHQTLDVLRDMYQEAFERVKRAKKEGNKEENGAGNGT
jgi:hypothetical protein